MVDPVPNPGPDLEEEGLEDDLLAWFVEWHREDEMVEEELKDSYKRLRRIRREIATIDKRMRTEVVSIKSRSERTTNTITELWTIILGGKR